MNKRENKDGLGFAVIALLAMALMIICINVFRDDGIDVEDTKIKAESVEEIEDVEANDEQAAFTHKIMDVEVKNLAGLSATEDKSEVGNYSPATRATSRDTADYEVWDYDDPDMFADDWWDEFDDNYEDGWECAYDYWEEYEE